MQIEEQVATGFHEHTSPIFRQFTKLSLLLFAVWVSLMAPMVKTVKAGPIRTWNIRFEGSIPTGDKHGYQSKVLTCNDDGSDILMANYFSLIAIHCSPNERPEYIGTLVFNRGYEVLDIAITGMCAYALLKDHGIAIVDISDLQSMRMVGSLNAEAADLPNPNSGLWINEDLLMAAFISEGDEPNDSRILIYDISSPANPELAFDLTLRGKPLTFSRNVLVSAIEDTLLRISELAENQDENILFEAVLPEIKVAVEDENRLVVGTASGVFAYTFDGEEWAAEGSFLTDRDGSISCIDLRDDELLAGCRIGRLGGNLHLFDISDWQNPRVLNTIELGSDYVTLLDGLAYSSSLRSTGARQLILENNQFAGANEITLPTSDYRKDLLTYDDRLYYGSTQCFDISNPRRPIYVAYGNGGNRMVRYGEYIICGEESFDFENGFVGAIASEPEDGILRDYQYIRTIHPDGMQIYDENLVVIDARQATWLVHDISDPENIRQEPIRGPAHPRLGLHMGVTTVCIGNILYTALSESENYNEHYIQPGFLVWQINDWQDAELISRVDFNGDVISEHQGYVLASQYPGRRLAWWNVENPEEPFVEHECVLDTNTYINHFKLSNNLLFGLFGWGINVFDIHTPGEANLVAYAHINPDYGDSLSFLQNFGSYFDIEGPRVVAPLLGLDVFTLLIDENVEEVASISLAPGWNLISSHIEPANEDIRNIFGQIVERDDLILVKDYLGRFYIPEEDFNNIPNWDYQQGYLVKTRRREDLPIVGRPEAADAPIPLREGWSMVAYFPEDIMDARMALENIVNSLLLAKDGEGHFYIPARDFSNMPNLRRGKGYQVKVSEDVDLVWNVEEGRLMQITKPAQLQHFTMHLPSIGSMSILVEGASSFEEIAAFTVDRICVGADCIAESGMTGIALWADDPTTAVKDGAASGDTILFRGWDGENEQSLEATWLEGDGQFELDAIGVINVRLSLPFRTEILNQYPNPFNTASAVTYSLSLAGNVSLKVFDLNGRLVETLVETRQEPGYHRATWQAGNVPAGLYFCRLEASGFMQSVKLLLVK